MDTPQLMLRRTKKLSGVLGLLAVTACSTPKPAPLVAIGSQSAAAITAIKTDCETVPTPSWDEVKHLTPAERSKIKDKIDLADVRCIVEERGKKHDGLGLIAAHDNAVAEVRGD